MSSERKNYLLKNGMGTVAASDYNDHPERYDVVKESDQEYDTRITNPRRAGVQRPRPITFPVTTIPNLATYDPMTIAAAVVPPPAAMFAPAVVSELVLTEKDSVTVAPNQAPQRASSAAQPGAPTGTPASQPSGQPAPSRPASQPSGTPPPSKPATPATK